MGCSGHPWKPHYVRTGSEFRITREGWVERRSGGVWRPLTSHYFWDNNYGAQIVCRNMRFGTGTRTHTRRQQNQEQFDTETGNRRCAANNDHILQCRRHGGPNQRDLSAQAHVICSGHPWKPHYVRTGSEFRITREGWVERRSGGRWRPLTSHYFWDNNYGAQIVCRNLGFGTGTRTHTRNRNNRANFDPIGNRRCHAGATNINQCRKHGGPNNNDKSAQAHVRCSGQPYKRPPFHRVGSEFAISGNSRTGHVWRKGGDGAWRPLTSHYFWDNNYGAAIVCRNMGYGTGVRTRTRRNGNQELFDSIGNRRCNANNRRLSDCRKYGGPNNRDLSAQAHVRCSGKPWRPHYVRTGKEFRIPREGWVERRSGGVWRPISSHWFWDNNYGATIVCRDLRYGKGVVTKKRNPHNRSNFDPIGKRRCAAGHKHITQCRQHGGSYNHDKSAQANVR